MKNERIFGVKDGESLSDYLARTRLQPEVALREILRQSLAGEIHGSTIYDESTKTEKLVYLKPNVINWW